MKAPFSRGATLLSLAVAVLTAAPASGKVIERIVAVVNKNIILLSQLEQRLQPIASQLAKIPDPEMRKQRREQLSRQLLDHMIDEQLIKQEADRLKLDVSDQDLELAIKDVMRKNNLTREQLEAALRQEGQSIAQYKRQILGPQLLRLRVINVQVRSRVSVTDDEIKALYQKNLRALGVETKVRARHIFIGIPPGATGRVVDERKRLANTVLALTKKKGADFDALAKKWSQDSVTRGDGGDLGFFGRGTLPARVEEVVFSMKKGEIRGPLRADRGFHVIQVTDRVESSAKPLSEVEEELRNEIYGQKVDKATKVWLQEVRKRSFVEIRH